MYDFMAKMGWSSKIPISFQIQKYNGPNLLRYVSYLNLMQSDAVDIKKVKFADESHFTKKVYKGMKNKDKKLNLIYQIIEITCSHILGKRCWGLKSNRVYNKVCDLEDTVGTLTLFCGLDEDVPVYIEYNENTNDQYTFANALFRAIGE
jgi:hypothetical protein